MNIEPSHASMSVPGPEPAGTFPGLSEIDLVRSAGLLLVTLATYVILKRFPPPGDFHSLFGAWPHIVCAAAFGMIARGLDVRVTAPLTCLLSLLVIVTLFGRVALAINVVQAIAVYLAVRATLRSRASVAAACVSTVLALGLLGCWYYRAIGAVGIWVFGLLRYISFAVDCRRGASPRFVSFVLYSFYYPALLQTEQYTDFVAKNLTAPWSPDLRRAAGRLVQGWIKMTAGVAIAFTFNDVLAIDTFTSGWALVLLVYLRAVLFMTGVYDTVQAISSLHGATIRENFSGVLLADGASAFWRRWRSTMTEFFITYVYIPLGGREHRVRNIFAVFGCSVLWHWIGVPFFGGRQFNPHFLPVLCFGLWNSVIMGIGALLDGWLGSRGRDDHEQAIRRELRVFATAVFGSITVLLLSYTPVNADRLFPNLWVLCPVGMKFLGF